MTVKPLSGKFCQEDCNCGKGVLRIKLGESLTFMQTTFRHGITEPWNQEANHKQSLSSLTLKQCYTHKISNKKGEGWPGSEKKSS